MTQVIDWKGVKLGAKRPKILPNQPDFSRVKAFIEPKAPPMLHRADIDPHPQMFDNDQIGDCSSAGLANIMLASTALWSRDKITVPLTAADAVRFYEQSTGYNPAVPGSDQGGVLTEVLAYAMSHGYKVGQWWTYVPLWGSLDIHDQNAIANVMHTLGAVYCGFGLAEADQYTVGQVWDTTTPGDQSSWSWGGHCAVLWSYAGLGDTDLVDILTWGGIQKATWRWVKARMFEAHAVGFRQLLPASGTNQLGDTWDQMVQLNNSYLLAR